MNRYLLLLGAAVALLLAPGRARAQCLPWPALLREVAEGQLSAAMVATYVPADSWEAHESPTAAAWQYRPEVAALAGAATRLELRRVNSQLPPDLVFKTTRKDCLRELRAELRRAHLKGKPVTCLGCEAEHFEAEGYAATLYSQEELFRKHKVSHPFVLVVHGTAAAGAVVGGN